jgi:hypothetical protein
VICDGCGANVPDVPELRADHLYVGAAAGCWSAYTELIGRQMADRSLGEGRMLGVDIYMSQHPGVPGRQSSQSVWVHLVGLYLSLEHGYDGAASARAKARVAAPDAEFTWLEPPRPLGRLTVLDVLAAESPDESRRLVHEWADSVWQAWAPHHEAIRLRAASILARG